VSPSLPGCWGQWGGEGCGNVGDGWVFSGDGHGVRHPHLAHREGQSLWRPVVLGTSML
jgi:hypothetical protein